MPTHTTRPKRPDQLEDDPEFICDLCGQSHYGYCTAELELRRK